MRPAMFSTSTLSAVVVATILLLLLTTSSPFTFVSAATSMVELSVNSKDKFLKGALSTNSDPQDWYPVCSHSGFTSQTASTVCQLLGFSTASFTNEQLVVVGQMTLTGLTCPSGATSTMNCTWTNPKATCSGGKQVKLTCSSPSFGAGAGVFVGGNYFLRQSSTSSSRVLQVRKMYTMDWRSVASDDCNNKYPFEAGTATAVCTWLGYKSLTWASFSAVASPPASVGLTGLFCSPSDSGIGACKFSYFHTATTATSKCMKSIKLDCNAQTYGIQVGSGYDFRLTTSNILQVRPQFSTTWGAICNKPMMNLQSSGSLCYLLGYRLGGRTTNPNTTSTGLTNYLGNISCAVSPATLAGCKYSKFPTGCADKDVTSLQCYTQVHLAPSPNLDPVPFGSKPANIIAIVVPVVVIVLAIAIFFVYRSHKSQKQEEVNELYGAHVGKTQRFEYSNPGTAAANSEAFEQLQQVAAGATNAPASSSGASSSSSGAAGYAAPQVDAM